MDPEHASAREPRASRASHREIADELRSRIGSGALRPGQRMPTQAELAEEFGVERGAVRQALDILHAERLLTGVSKGSPARVAQDAWPGWSAAPPQPTVVGLGPRVAAAFAASRVRIDALCLTSVSLTLAVGEQLRLIHAGELKPAKIDVRVLLPSHRIGLAFPTPVDPVNAGDGGLLHERWLAVRNAQGLVLRQNLLALRTTHGIDVRLTFRALPFTPPVKLYLLNEAEALFAYYTLGRHEQRESGGEPLQSYDADGTRSLLFAFGPGAGTRDAETGDAEAGDAGARDAAFVAESRRWFDALWETISSDLELT
ncbi:GntR family transcriptional regulator [Streptomyces sp. S816]|uniref:winged helix-turn-helix domain-containing protein n=1 Tax=Streptomyces sp. S816 TaxID=2283197 RepID=UPI00109CBAA9|nr:winged helix-turn-helix domain-containing protein [Streptomyces sp. S816]TGZ17119.1 GntR family transcriptional regulator [Streptomyces sp. S816]